MPKYVDVGRILLARCNDGNYCRVAVKAVKEDKAQIHVFDQGRTIVSFFFKNLMNFLYNIFLYRRVSLRTYTSFLTSCKL